MAKVHAVGIDLGTTNSAVAYMDRTGRTEMIRNHHGDLLTPSVVLFDDQEIIVGKEAKKAIGLLNDRVAEAVKRDMGSVFYSRPIRGEHLPPEVIQSCILRRLRADIFSRLGPEHQVVITVPAYFDEPRRQATADAGEMAGLQVLDIVNEPTAAALAYGEQLGYLDAKGAPRESMKVLVYDLGGGTFDATVLVMEPGSLRTLATDGDVQLGGRDWDARLADELAEQFLKQHGQDVRSDAAGRLRLMRVAEETKHTLSVRDRATAHMEFGGRTADLVVARERFEELCADLLERTAYTTRQVLASAQVKWSDISQILLVGGSTRMPMVPRMLEALSGMKPAHAVNPDEAVARGAAVFAAYLMALQDELGPGPAFRVTDVNSHSLGIEGIDQKTMRKENIILIPRNTPLPYYVSEKFVTKADNQKTIVIQVLEGESKVPNQCAPIARAVMRELPGGLPKGWPVEVTYEYQTNGRLAVQAKVPGTKSAIRIDLERQKGMTDDRVARWKQAVTADKGFNMFESMLEDVLDLEATDPPSSESSSTSNVAIASRSTAPQQPETRPTPVASPATATHDSPRRDPTAQTGSRIATPTAAPASDSTSSATSTGTLSTSDFEEVEMLAALTPPVAQQPPSPPPAATQSATVATPTAPPSPAPQISATASRTGRKSGAGSAIMAVLGPIIGGVVGLVLGYYILCLIAPEANFLRLSLPGVTPHQSAPASPANAPSPSR